MIQLFPCKTEAAVDVSGLDPIRIQGKIMEHNIEGRPVLVGFGAAPKYLSSRGTVYRLVPVTPLEFRQSLPAQEDQASIDMWSA